MKIIKRIFIGLFALVIFAVIGIIVYFWPVDPRLNGTFKSDKEATISYLKTISTPTEKNLNVWDQMYGHLTYIFDGHKVKVIYESHTINYSDDSKPSKIDAFEQETYFFMRRSDIGKEKVEIIFLSPFWDIEEKSLEIELDKDGFWLNTPLYKEKFTKIKR